MKWKERVSRAQTRGYYIYDDISASQSWRTCYIGEKVSHLNGDEDLSDELMQLGWDFSDSIRHGLPFETEKIMREIDDILSGQ